MSAGNEGAPRTRATRDRDERVRTEEGYVDSRMVDPLCDRTKAGNAHSSARSNLCERMSNSAGSWGRLRPARGESGAARTCPDIHVVMESKSACSSACLAGREPACAAATRSAASAS